MRLKKFLVLIMAVFVFSFGLAMVASAADQIATDADTTDWPTVIASLKQEVFRQPGLLQTKQQLAIAYNNYGVSLGGQGQWQLAAEQLKEAIRLDANNTQAKDNLGRIYLNQAYDAFKRHQTSEAMEAIDQALAINPQFAQAYALRGDIEYGRQHLKEAKASWDQAVKLDPTQTELAKKLSQVTQELPVESDFEQVSQAYFDVRYQEGLEPSVGFDVRDILAEARRQIGSDFSYWPKHKLVVLVYSADSFHRLRQQTPEWVGGQFDGKIRVPLPNGQTNLAMVKQILFHEYTHALIYDLTNGLCPTWLNEGLAEYEGRTQNPAPLTQLAAASQQERLVPWNDLSDEFSPTLPADTVALGYQQSYSITRYLIERSGFWRIRRLLKAVGEGQSWVDAIPKEYNLKLNTIERNWREWLPTLLNTSAE